MDQVNQSSKPKSKRILFIDALRAYAILMMLQGHFIDTLLADKYRNPESLLYSAWNFMRGMTAPIFFTSSGLIVVFLMLKDGRPLKDNIRVKKGIRRGFFLILLGYLLKWNLGAVLKFHFYRSFISLDVLHSIGIALLLLIMAYALHKVSRIPLLFYLFFMGMGVFLLYNPMLTQDWSGLPIFFQNYVTLANGSVFTPIPWVGYTLIGGLLGWQVHRFQKWYATIWSAIPIFLVGLTLHLYSYELTKGLSDLISWPILLGLVEQQWLFWRMGQVFIVLSLFILLTQIFYRFIPALFLTIGSETLTIYSVHYVLLYGTWTGIGLKSILGERSLNAWQAGVGAVLFIVFFVYLVYRLEDIRAWLDKEVSEKVKSFLAPFQRRIVQDLRRVFTKKDTQA